MIFIYNSSDFCLVIIFYEILVIFAVSSFVGNPAYSMINLFIYLSTLIHQLWFINSKFIDSYSSTLIHLFINSDSSTRFIRADSSIHQLWFIDSLIHQLWFIYSLIYQQWFIYSSTMIIYSLIHQLEFIYSLIHQLWFIHSLIH